ncbi:TetR/AcrR family transcriptional regulator [Kribbella antibiotica]|uniref:TetR/AcrR family transcriptional regulator n=1 Tax=Kribbella antibiotica TaxID=190195 RepID=A0A4V2YQM7_9ACTN|nr:TetR/AcrR family transcriptional regulator [Kribbella antibiotica]TDD62697.1 TetR/AcrR family transcriptional regulator [Kribbella antibiotica]
MPSITRTAPDSEGNRRVVETAVYTAVRTLLDSGAKYTEISVQKILAEADISRSTFYAHFRDKSELLARMGRSLNQRFFDEATADAATIWDAVESPDGLQSITELLAKGVARHREHFSVLAAISETAAYDAAVNDFYTSGLEAFEARVRADLEKRLGSALTDSKLNARISAQVIVWGGEQAIAHHISTEDESQDADFAAELAAIWWYGAYNRRTESS